MKFAWPILLQFLSILAGMAEALLPSFGLLTVLCLSLFGYSWFWILTRLSGGAPWIFGAADIVIIPCAVYAAFKLLGIVKISHHSSLGSGAGLEDQENALKKIIGEFGIVESSLRPVGKILVGETVFEAKAEGEFLAQGERIKILRIIGTQIIVERA
jgi:membrane-bound ClpP family serine protease